LHENNFHPNSGVELIFVCENCLHLRQCLHPESVKKSLDSLPDYYWSYLNLKLEFEKFYRISDGANLKLMLERLNISSLSEIDYCLRNVKHMELIVHRMLNDGHRFEKPELIMRHLQPGLW